MKIDKNIDFGRARQKRTSPSNSTRKTTLIDLFSSRTIKNYRKCVIERLRTVYTIVKVYSDFVILFLHVWIPLSTCQSTSLVPFDRMVMPTGACSPCCEVTSNGRPTSIRRPMDIRRTSVGRPRRTSVGRAMDVRQTSNGRPASLVPFDRMVMPTGA